MMPLLRAIIESGSREAALESGCTLTEKSNDWQGK
jgi:hypothetical protein